MKIDHDQIRYISPPDAAILLAVGWVNEWPWEVPKTMAKLFRKWGYQRYVQQARDAAIRAGIGELTERPPTHG